MFEVTDEMKKLVDDELGDIDIEYCHWGEYRDSTIKRIIELHEQSKPKPEPVGYAWVVNNRVKMIADTELNSGFRPLYTTPPTREPLSEDEAWEMWANIKGGNVSKAVHAFARAIEQAHGIGANNE